jgi:hypothetical protein
MTEEKEALPKFYFSYKKIEEKALPNFYLSHKKILATGALTGLLRCKTCKDNSTLGDFLDQLEKKELIALKKRINARLFFMKRENEP